MNETINNLITRRSVRSFQKEQISEEQLNEILTAGTYAASGMGRQSAIMVVIQNPEIIKRLSKLNAAIMDSENDPFYGAPTVVVDEKYVGIGNCILGYGKEPKPEAKPRKDNYIYRV